MATFYSQQLYVNETLTGVASAGTPLSATVTQILFKESSDPKARVVFDTVSNLTTAAVLTSTFTGDVSGKIVFNTAYTNTPVFVVLPNRTSFQVSLSSGSTLATSNGFSAWGKNEIRLRNLGYF